MSQTRYECLFDDKKKLRVDGHCRPTASAHSETPVERSIPVLHTELCCIEPTWRGTKMLNCFRSVQCALK